MTAAPDEGYHFKGWYIGSNLQSDAAEYRFCVLTAVTLEAVFEKIDDAGNHNPGGGGASGGAPVTAPAIEHNDGGKVTVNDDGSVAIIPEAGYAVKEILINGEPANEEALQKLKSTDKVEVIFEKINAWANPFSDVKESDWFYNSVKYAHGSGLFSGTSVTTFSPNATMTRAMMVTVLHCMAGAPVAAKAAFADVPDGAWYGDAVNWAVANHIVSGIGNDLFAPDAAVTREQMAVMLYNYAKAMHIQLPATRATGSFADADQISAWAKEAVDAMYAAQILNGKGDGMFDPRGTATRAEVATMFMNFLAMIP